MREIRALLKSIERHQQGFHVLVGDFNTLAPGEILDVRRMPAWIRGLVWFSGRDIQRETIQHMRTQITSMGIDRFTRTTKATRFRFGIRTCDSITYLFLRGLLIACLSVRWWQTCQLHRKRPIIFRCWQNSTLVSRL